MKSLSPIKRLREDNNELVKSNKSTTLTINAFFSANEFSSAKKSSLSALTGIISL